MNEARLISKLLEESVTNKRIIASLIDHINKVESCLAFYCPSSKNPDGICINCDKTTEQPVQRTRQTWIPSEAHKQRAIFNRKFLKSK